MAGADAAADHGGASRSIEVERTFDAEAVTPLPDLRALPGVVSVDEPELRELDARYFDTAGLAMAAAGYALRRRTGGPDAGWHIKGPRVDGGRVELGWPLEDGDEGVPDAVRAVAGTVTAGELRPIARIRNTRTAYVLRSGTGVLAEFVDDRVVATDFASGTVREWREWEIELGPDAPADAAAFFAAAEAAVLSVGGRAAASDSKLARALGY